MTAEEVFQGILGKLTSQDRDVLEFCKAYLIELTAEENNRSRRAEDKAQVPSRIPAVTMLYASNPKCGKLNFIV